jgi:hypothetical protein
MVMDAARAYLASVWAGALRGCWGKKSEPPRRLGHKEQSIFGILLATDSFAAGKGLEWINKSVILQ